MNAGVQTNRDSIMRHHEQNGGTPPSSDDENSPRPQARSILQDRMSALNSERTVGKDNNSVNRNILKGLKYPTKDTFHPSANTQDLMRKVMSDDTGKSAVAEVLNCAMNDEFVDLDRAWRIGTRDTRQDEGKKVEDRVAACLKRLAKRAEKACAFNSLAGAKAPRPSAASSVPEDADAAAREIEAKIAESEQRIARYREELQRPARTQDSEAHHVFADLSDRLSAAQSGPEMATFVAGMDEIASDVGESLQGLAAVEVCCRHMWQQYQDEQQALQDRNSEFCPPASTDHQVPSHDRGGRSILRGIK